MPALRHCVALTCITLLQLAGLSLFFCSFFSTSASQRGFYRSGHAGIHGTVGGADANANFTSAGDSAGAPAVYDSLVMLVIDALPVRFLDVRVITQTNGTRHELPNEALAMPYVDKLLRHPDVHGFNLESATPTLTSLRLKTILTGMTVGNMMEISNCYPPRPFSEDSLIAQMRLKGWNISFLGDDTWLKMFPGQFARSTGVDSDFVKDTDEVDNKIKSEIPKELDPGTEWNMLILHFLGVDHVGHKGGLTSQLMLPKLREMDAVIDDVHARLRARDKARGTRSLLLVLSDHGMNAKGSHGGFSPDESRTINIFIPADVNLADTATDADLTGASDEATSDTHMPADITANDNDHTRPRAGDPFPRSSTGTRGLGENETDNSATVAYPARDFRTRNGVGNFRADSAVQGPPVRSFGPGSSAPASTSASSSAAAPPASSSNSSFRTALVLLLGTPRRRPGGRFPRLSRKVHVSFFIKLVTDIAPTLALLLGLPVPAQSEGLPLAPLLDRLPPDKGATSQPTTGTSRKRSPLTQELDFLRRINANALRIALIKKKRRLPGPTPQATAAPAPSPDRPDPLDLLLEPAKVTEPAKSMHATTREGTTEPSLSIHGMPAVLEPSIALAPAEIVPAAPAMPVPTTLEPAQAGTLWARWAGMNTWGLFQPQTAPIVTVSVVVANESGGLVNGSGAGRVANREHLTLLVSAWNNQGGSRFEAAHDGQQGLDIHEQLMRLPPPWSALVIWAIQLASVTVPFSSPLPPALVRLVYAILIACLILATALVPLRRANAGAVLVAAVEGFALASLLASATMRAITTGGAAMTAQSLGPPWEVVLIFQGWGYATFFGLGNTNGFETVDVVSPLMV
eukprot:jgi/Mesvir1/219/Mv13563-RA.1